MREMQERNSQDQREPLVLPFSLEQESFFGTYPVTAANTTPTYRVDGALDVGALRAAVHLLKQRHEALRFRITPRGRPSGQVIAPPERTGLETAQVSPQRLWEHVDEAHSVPLDLAGEGPVRFRLYRTTPQQHFLCTTIHSAALDAWGVGIVNRELWDLYDHVRSGSPADPAMPLYTFTDHIRRQQAAGGKLTAPQRYYFREQVAGLAALSLSFPLPVPPKAADARGIATPVLLADEQFTVDAASVDRIARLARERGVTTAAIFLAGFELGLCFAAGADSGGLSCVYIGRERPETQGMAAALARRVPLRFEVAASDRLGDFIERAMLGWALAVSKSGPPYSSARLVQEIGGRAGAFEPVFNFRVFGTSARRAPGTRPNRPSVQRVQEPCPRAMPMWSQFGEAALFALVSHGKPLTVTAIYDPRQVPAVNVKTVFAAYEHVMQNLGADSGVSVTIGRLRASLSQQHR